MPVSTSQISCVISPWYIQRASCFRCVFRALSNIYDEAFLLMLKPLPAKMFGMVLNTFRHLQHDYVWLRLMTNAGTTT